MNEYCVPTGAGESEYVEKRSRFLGHVRPAESEEEAKAFVAAVKKEHYDARHNCWCYIIHDGPERYSDDGEPQGTAGIPMLEVLRREGVSNVVCVVTRYFGGVLLGTGGLFRDRDRGLRRRGDGHGVRRGRDHPGPDPGGEAGELRRPHFRRLRRQRHAAGHRREPAGCSPSVGAIRFLYPAPCPRTSNARPCVVFFSSNALCFGAVIF